MADKLPLLLLLAAGATFTSVWLILLRKRLNMAWYVAIPIAIVHTLYGVLTVKAFAFLETGFDKASIGNMSLFGGVFFMPLAYWLGAKISRRPTGEVFDIFTPCMIFTVMCARVNCILSGCCRGMLIPGTNATRFPTREIELVFYVILLAVLCPQIFRFVNEFFREADTQMVFHRSHIWAVLALIIGTAVNAEIQSRKSKEKRRK